MRSSVSRGRGRRLQALEPEDPVASPPFAGLKHSIHAGDPGVPRAIERPLSASGGAQTTSTASVAAEGCADTLPGFPLLRKGRCSRPAGCHSTPDGYRRHQDPRDDAACRRRSAAIAPKPPSLKLSDA